MIHKLNTAHSLLFYFFFCVFFWGCSSKNQKVSDSEIATKPNAKAKVKSKKLNCKKVKTGLFVYGDYRIGETIIKRTNEKQFETNEKQNYKVSFDIEWTDACTYILKNKILNGKPSNDEDLKVTIIDVKPDLYTVLVQSENSSKLMELDIGIKSLKLNE